MTEKKLMGPIAFALAILACGVVHAADGGGSSVGPANPASVYCKDLKGSLELETAPGGGQYANCVVDQWTLFRDMSSKGLVIHHNYGPGGMPNPAAVNCEDVGGTIRVVDTNEGQEGDCVIEEWTLFRATHPTS